jgi:putative membrane protein insertion efficiency factor
MSRTARRLAWALGWPARILVLGLIELYRFTLGPMFAGRCRFYPSCSNYAVQAVRRHGALKGSLLAGWRLLRCSPLTSGGLDPVPEHGRWRGSPKPSAYDSVIHEEAAP